MRRIVYLLALATVLAAGGTATAGDHPDKVTLCHASGLEGTTKYETLTVGYEAAYGPAGHFDENGTPNAGHEQDYLGECQPPPPPTDVCPNLDGDQGTVPEGYELVDGQCVLIPPPPEDVCPNLEGVQETIPPGMGIVDGECVPVGINPLCAPPAVLVNGQCIVPPPPPVNPPNVTGNPDVFCDLGAQLYRVRGTVDGQAADTANPPTIPGNTRGFTNITLVRGDTQFRTVVFTYGDCSLAPPVVTVTPTPAAVVTPTTPATPAKPAAPAKPAKPTAKPKPKPKPKPAPPKKHHKVTPKPPVKHPHVCKTLADGTHRMWWKGGNGMPAGCYPTIPGSG